LISATVRRLSVPKRCCQPDECEDATWVGARPGGLRIAVADGASESLLAGRWARHLVISVGGFVGSAVTGFVPAYVDATSTWPALVEAYVRERADRGSPIEWYEEPGLAKPAYATLAVLEIGDDGSWAGAAVGDSCVVSVQDGEVSSFPLDKSAEFTHQPPLLGSAGGEALVGASSGVVGSGDRLYVMTDALAEWFLRTPDASPALDGLDRAGFGAWVDGLRDAGELHDDDTTVVRVVVR
jgi:hypothetical protein